MADEIEGTVCRIARGGIQVGALGIADDERRAAVAALEAAGYQCDCPPSEVNFKAECSEDDHEVCDVSVALLYGLEIARDTGTAAPELEALETAGHGSKDEVRSGLVSLRDRLPEGSDERREAEETIRDLERGAIVA